MTCLCQSEARTLREPSKSGCTCSWNCAPQTLRCCARLFDLKGHWGEPEPSRLGPSLLVAHWKHRLLSVPRKQDDRPCEDIQSGGGSNASTARAGSDRIHAGTFVGCDVPASHRLDTHHQQRDQYYCFLCNQVHYRDLAAPKRLKRDRHPLALLRCHAISFHDLFLRLHVPGSASFAAIAVFSDNTHALDDVDLYLTT